MEITSKQFNKLRKWNKKSSTKRNIRVGVVVNSKRGLGIVTVRDKELLWVAHESDSWMWCHTYKYNINDVEVTEDVIDPETKLYKGAWNNILDSALQQNQMYEIEKHRAIVEEWSDFIKGKKSTREISTDFGSYTYTRFTGDRYDFEICTSNPSIRDGDKVLFALGKTNTIVDMNGHGRIYRRKIVDQDINYGLCKYVFNVDDDGNKIYT